MGKRSLGDQVALSLFEIAVSGVTSVNVSFINLMYYRLYDVMLIDPTLMLVSGSGVVGYAMADSITRVLTNKGLTERITEIYHITNKKLTSLFKS